MKNIEEMEESEVLNELIDYCYSMLSDLELIIFNKMLQHFPDITHDEMASGLSVIYMGYPLSTGYDGTADYILTEHSRLFDGWKPNRVELWLADFIANENPVDLDMKFN